MDFRGSTIMLCLIVLDIHTGLIQAKSQVSKDSTHALSRKKRTAPFHPFMTSPRWPSPFPLSRGPMNMPFPFPPDRGPMNMPFPFPPDRGPMHMPFPFPHPHFNMGDVGRMHGPGRPGFHRPMFGRRNFLPFPPFSRNRQVGRLPPPLPSPPPQFAPRHFVPGPNDIHRHITPRIAPNPGHMFRPRTTERRIPVMTGPDTRQGPVNFPTDVNPRRRALPSFTGHLQGPGSTNEAPWRSQFPIPIPAISGVNTRLHNPIPHCYGAFVQNCRLLRPNENPTHAHRCQGNCPGRTCFVNCICTCERVEGQGSMPFPGTRGTGGQGPMDVVPPRMFMARMLDGSPALEGQIRSIGFGMDGPDLGGPDTFLVGPGSSNPIAVDSGSSDILMPNTIVGVDMLDRIGPGVESGPGMNTGLGVITGPGMNTGLGVISGPGMNTGLGAITVPGMNTGLGAITGPGLDLGLGVKTGLGGNVSPGRLPLSAFGFDISDSESFQVTPFTDETLAKLLSEQDLNFLVGPSGVNSMIAGEPPILDIPILTDGHVPLLELGMSEISLNLPEPEMHIIRSSDADARRVAARAGVGGQGSLSFGGMLQLEDSGDVNDAMGIPAYLRGIPVGLNVDTGFDNSLSVMAGPMQPSVHSASHPFPSLGGDFSLTSFPTEKTILPVPSPAPAPPRAKQMLPIPYPLPAPPLASTAANHATSAPGSPLVSINSHLADAFSVLSGAQDAAFGPIANGRAGAQWQMQNVSTTGHASHFPALLLNPFAKSAFDPMMANLLGVADFRSLRDSESGSAVAPTAKLAMAGMDGSDVTTDHSTEQGRQGSEIHNSSPSELEMLVSLLGIPTPLSNFPGLGFHANTGSLNRLPSAHAPVSNTFATNSSGQFQPNLMGSFLSGTITATDPMVERESGESCQVQQRELWCDPVGVWDGTPGVSKWCLLNCQTNINCDRKMCACTCVDGYLFRMKYDELS